jgi:hypothetical protein
MGTSTHPRARRRRDAGGMSFSATLDAATPATRDRYVDLLRVTSLGVVILGHWLMAVVLIGPDGGVTATNLLAVVPELQPLTWLLQVMPVFFLVGGFSHAVALASQRRRAGSYADFVRSRAGRLLRPTAVFVAAWLLLALLLEVTGQHEGVLRAASRTVAQPLWFVGVYLGVVALAPPMAALHRRLGRRAWAVPVALAAGAAGVDALRFTAGVQYIGYLNVALVWLAVHQAGVLYADGTLARGGRRLAYALAGGGLAGAYALTVLGPYPVSMVGLPGEPVSNMSPPTLAMVAHATWLTGLVLLLRGAVTRWLRRPRVWATVVAANGLAMTAFLWHLTAMFAAIAATVAAGIALPAAGSAGWWLLRPVWVAALALLTAALVAAFRRADRPRPARTRPAVRARRRRALVAAAGAALCVAGVLGFSAVGFGGMLTGRSATLVVIPITPMAATVLLSAGALVLSASRWPEPGRHRAPSRVWPVLASWNGEPGRLVRVGGSRAVDGDVDRSRAGVL